MDGDMLTLKSMDDMLRAYSSDFGVARDFGNAYFWATFNAGLMVIRPNLTEFNRFMQVNYSILNTLHISRTIVCAFHA